MAGTRAATPASLVVESRLQRAGSAAGRASDAHTPQLDRAVAGPHRPSPQHPSVWPGLQLFEANGVWLRAIAPVKPSCKASRDPSANAVLQGNVTERPASCETGLQRRSAADLAADVVFLAVEDALVGSGDVTAVARSHAALLIADVAILAMKLARLATADLALATFLVDATILVVEAVVHLFTPRMIFLPRRICEGGAG